MKRALVSILAGAGLLLLTACGGGNSNPGSSSTPQTSGIKQRALISDRYNGLVYIFDAALDTSHGTNVSTGSGSSTLAVFPDKKHAVIVAAQSNSIAVLDTVTETVVANYPLSDIITDIALSSDNKTVYASLRNAPVTGQLNGLIDIIDTTSTTTAVAGSVNVPAVRHLALSHNGSKLLAFSDNTNTVALIDTASKAVTTIAGFDRPVGAVFSSDDATAYVLSCGAECGGTTAKVNALNLASNAVGADVIVSGATAALLDSGNLYVAGNSNGVGKLDIVSTSNMTVSKSGVGIANGYHSVMVLAQNNRLFIGSSGCSNVATGCLSIYNTSSGNVVNSAPGAGDTTGVQPITGRTVVYVIEGGELVIWDTATDAPLPANKQIDIVGQAWDAKLID